MGDYWSLIHLQLCCQVAVGLPTPKTSCWEEFVERSLESLGRKGGDASGSRRTTFGFAELEGSQGKKMFQFEKEIKSLFKKFAVLQLSVECDFSNLTL